MHKKQKWLPPYNAIILLSVLAAVIVTSAFIYFSATLYLTEKAISGPPGPPDRSKDSLRLLIAAKPDKADKNPLEADILSYLTQKMGKDIVPVQRTTLTEIDRVLAQNEFDIAFTSNKTHLEAAQKGYAELLVIPVSKHSSAETYLVSVRKNLDAATKQKVKEIFLNMKKDSSGRKVLATLGLRDFAEPTGSSDPLIQE